MGNPHKVSQSDSHTHFPIIDAAMDNRLPFKVLFASEIEEYHHKIFETPKAWECALASSLQKYSAHEDIGIYAHTHPRCIEEENERKR